MFWKRLRRTFFIVTLTNIFRKILVQTTSSFFETDKSNGRKIFHELFSYKLSSGQLGSWKRLSSYPATEFTIEGLTFVLKYFFFIQSSLSLIYHIDLQVNYCPFGVAYFLQQIQTNQKYLDTNSSSIAMKLKLFWNPWNFQITSLTSINYVVSSRYFSEIQ